MKKHRITFGGYTFPELIIVIAIMATLLGIITLNLGYVRQKTDINTAITTFVADFKEQQLKAMIGDTEGRNTSDTYGVYLGVSGYTLFHGATYSSSDTTNYTVPIGANLQFQNTGKVIQFTRSSGNVSSYNSAANTIVIIDITDNLQKTITFNQYGVITNVN